MLLSSVIFWGIRFVWKMQEKQTDKKQIKQKYQHNGPVSNLCRNRNFHVDNFMNIF